MKSQLEIFLYKKKNSKRVLYNNTLLLFLSMRPYLSPSSCINEISIRDFFYKQKQILKEFCPTIPCCCSCLKEHTCPHHLAYQILSSHGCTSPFLHFLHTEARYYEVGKRIYKFNIINNLHFRKMPHEKMRKKVIGLIVHTFRVISFISSRIPLLFTSLIQGQMDSSSKASDFCKNIGQVLLLVLTMNIKNELELIRID